MLRPNSTTQQFLPRRLTKQIRLATAAVQEYDAKHGTRSIGRVAWLMLHLTCSRSHAEYLVARVEGRARSAERAKRLRRS